MKHDIYNRLVELLQENGYELVHNAKGSHRKWKAPDRPEINITANLDDRHLANRILKLAGITGARL